MRKFYSSILFPLCCFLFPFSPSVFSQSILNRNYVITASSPGKKLHMIAIPQQDTEYTEGIIYILDKKGKVKETFHISNYTQCAFIVSDNGFLFQLETELENRLIDPDFRWKIFIHHPYDTVHPYTTLIDTIYNKSKEDFIVPFVFRIYKKEKKYYTGFKRKKINNDAISYYGDTLRIKYYKENCYFSLSTGKYLGYTQNDQRRKPFKNIPFQLTLMNGMRRDQLMDKLHKKYTNY